jgi:adenosylcobinamide kinase/adenosylcobinamide-phosphate guanylyltransferase
MKVHAKRRSPRSLILVIGGAASGKSRHALDLIGRGGPRAFVATAEPLDQEMTERIRRHRTGRGPDWTTVEVPIDLAHWVSTQAAGFQAFVIDCLTLWLSNLEQAGAEEAEIKQRTRDLLAVLQRVRARVVVVTNELGMGLVPGEPITRRFRDLAGWMNQQFADAADEVHFVVSGIAQRIK